VLKPKMRAINIYCANLKIKSFEMPDAHYLNCKENKQLKKQLFYPWFYCKFNGKE